MYVYMCATVAVSSVTLSGVPPGGQSSLMADMATTLTCVTSLSSPAPIITWYGGRQSVPNSTLDTQEGSGLFTVTSTMEFVPISADNGQDSVYCSASNGFGDVISSKPTLIVLCKYKSL
jgi:hypothetical protein